jgi:hypothetical protein
MRLLEIARRKTQKEAIKEATQGTMNSAPTPEGLFSQEQLLKLCPSGIRAGMA